MIPVEPAPEPDDFDARVRQPGKAAIASYQEALDKWHVDGAPSHGKPDLKPLWSRCADELMERYHRICAYACFYIDPVTGARTVEHLAPKSKHPDLAYEWRNYRLCCSTMNSRKNDFEDVLDPFEIGTGWFQIEFVNGTVHPAHGLDEEIESQVRQSIDRLRLNDGDLTAHRTTDFDEYQACDMSWRRLERYSPFVAMEVDRQGLRRPADA